MQRKVYILGTASPGDHSLDNLNTSHYFAYCDFTRIVQTFTQLKFAGILVKYFNSLLE